MNTGHNKTLVILSPGFPADESDSTCLPPLQLFTRLLKKDNPSLQVIVVSFQYPFLKKEYDWHGCRVIAFGGKSKGRFHRLVLWFRVWKKLKQLKKENHLIGLLSFWLGECALIGKRFAARHALQHYCWLQGQDAKDGNKYVQWMNPSDTKLIAISDFIAVTFFENYGIKPQHTIPIGIDPEEFATGNVSKQIDILGAGSLIPLKQYDVFVEVISKIREELPAVNALICGAGPEAMKLKKMISSLQLENNIRLAGELPHAAVLDNMQQSRLFLHTSNYEGFGAVCIEALYAGARVISFCKPMDAGIPNWYTVKTKEQMIGKAIELLQNQNQVVEKPMPYSMHETVSRIMHLFVE